jgi:hypothetical protein
MNFKVHTVGTVTDYYHGDSSYQIGEANGVLTVDQESGGKIIYGPSGWLRVDERADDDGGAPSIL